MSKRVRIAAGALGMALLVACAPAPVADAGDKPAAKQPAPGPDAATVYVYRNEWLGAAVRMAVSVDGERVGITRGKTYLLLRLAPGQHAIYSQDQVRRSIALDVEAGKSYYVWQEVTHNPLSFTYRSRLKVVDEATGKAGLAECELSAVE